MKQKISISEIASLTGFSVGTVSGVMNGHHVHSPETVARVRSVVRETGYRPRRYKGRKTTKSLQQFGFLFPEVAQGKGLVTYLGIELTRGADEVFAADNNELIITEMRPNGKIPVCIERKQVEGLIIRDGDYPENLDDLLKEIPSVWVIGNRPHPMEFDSVRLDNLQLGEVAAEKLVKASVKHIVMLEHQDQFNMELAIRLLACEETLKRKGFTCERVSLDHLPEAVSKHKRKICGVFIPGHDREVIEACQTLQDNGLKPCTQIPIVCAATDRDAILKKHPGLITLWINPFALGRVAAQQLLWRLSHLDEPPQSILLRPEL